MTKYCIPNLANACRVMSYIGMSSRAFSCMEISKALGIPRTSSFRILETLAAENFLAKDGNCRYSLGVSLSNLGDCQLARMNILNIAPKLLEELTAETGETSHIGIQSDTHILIAKVCVSPLQLHASSQTGAIVDMHCSGTGKAILSQIFKNDSSFLKRLKLNRRTAHTITSASALAKEMSSTLKRGYALDNEEYHVGVRCLAVPVMDKFGTCVGAVGITAPAIRFDKRKKEKMYAVVAKIGQKMEKQLGVISKQ